MYRYLSPNAWPVGASNLQTSAAAARRPPRSPKCHQRFPQNKTWPSQGVHSCCLLRQANAGGHPPLRMPAECLLCAVPSPADTNPRAPVHQDICPGIVKNSQLLKPPRISSLRVVSSMQPMSMCSLLTLQTLASFLQGPPTCTKTPHVLEMLDNLGDNVNGCPTFAQLFERPMKSRLVCHTVKCVNQSQLTFLCGYTSLGTQAGIRSSLCKSKAGSPLSLCPSCHQSLNCSCFGAVEVAVLRTCT